jgi:hypothetical protein
LVVESFQFRLPGSVPRTLPEKGSKVMKTIRNFTSRLVYVLVLVGLLLVAVPRVQAQHDGNHDADDLFNPAPCDFNDTFYQENGIIVAPGAGINAPIAKRFGTFRQFGPPSRSGTQPNWVADQNNCLAKDPNRRNFRILATTGAYKDDTGNPTEFFSIIAFLTNQNMFEQTFTRTVGGNTVSIVNGLNPRGFAAVDIINQFEAYGGVKQTLTSGPFAGTLAPTPCGSLADPAVAANDCFPVGSVPFNGGTILAVESPNLRQDWRVASNRNAMDGSDNNCINPDRSVCSTTAFRNSPFGYFCDDLLGAWIVTYFWYTQNAVGGIDSRGHTIKPTSTCKTVLAAAGAQNGLNLDGTPIIHNGTELHFIEGVPGTPPEFGFTQAQTNTILAAEATAPCGAEGNLNPNGSDGGAVWLICPVIPDPRDGAIALDAFLDSVHNPNGSSLDPRFDATFACLATNGQFPLPNGVCPP